METKYIDIEIPEGYEIDEEKSTFSKIVFKAKEKAVKRWEDLKTIEGYYINYDSMILGGYNCPVISENQNIFATEKQAQSALAYAQITQLLPHYNGHTEFIRKENNYAIVYDLGTNEFAVERCVHVSISQFYFLTLELAKEFISNNEYLLKQFYMVD